MSDYAALICELADLGITFPDRKLRLRPDGFGLLHGREGCHIQMGLLGDEIERSLTLDGVCPDCWEDGVANPRLLRDLEFSTNRLERFAKLINREETELVQIGFLVDELVGCRRQLGSSGPFPELDPLRETLLDELETRERTLHANLRTDEMRARIAAALGKSVDGALVLVKSRLGPVVDIDYIHLVALVSWRCGTLRNALMPQAVAESLRDPHPEMGTEIAETLPGDTDQVFETALALAQNMDLSSALQAARELEHA